VSINNRPEDSQWGSNYPPVDPTGEKQSWKRQTGKNPAARIQAAKDQAGTSEPGKNNAGQSESGTKRPKFLRHPARFTLALLADTWTRLEDRWEANPGFFAATAAGSVGLVLIAAMLFNAGVGWLQDDPAGDDVAVDSPDSATVEPADSDLGDPSGDEIFTMKGKSKPAFPEEDDDPGIDSDPFAETRTRDKPIARIIVVDPVDDEPDDATETEMPVKIAKAATPQEADPFDKDDSPAEDSEPTEPESKQEMAAAPAQKSTSLDDDDEDHEPDEPVVQRPLPQMKIASRPQLPVVEMDEDQEKEVAAKANPATEADEPTAEAEEPPAEPAKLKPQSQVNVATADDDDSLATPILPAKPIKSDDTPKADRSIDLAGGPTEKAVPEQDPRWRQQRSKSITENPAPAVIARQSTPVETRIFAPAKPAQESKPSQPAKPSQLARSNQVVRENRATSEKSSASPLRLAMSGPPSVGLGQPCQIEIHVTNTSKEPARRFVVSAELPPGLVHEVSQSLEQQVEALAPGATYRALLRLRGKALGAKTIQVEVSQADSNAGERATVQLSAEVRVVPVSETATAFGSDDCACAPLMR